MAFHDRYGFTDIINAAGTYTPLGVSRSSSEIARATGQALTRPFVVDELQAALSAAVARATGAEAAAAVHCVAAAITLAVAAAMTGGDPVKVAALPDSTGMPDQVVLPAGHAVNYGHPIEQDIRLAGARPVLAGTEEACSPADLDAALAAPGVAALLLVSSRLVRGVAVDLAAAVAAAHRHGLPAIIDGAAQDRRIDALLATGADLVLVSAHKYLASPTAGLVIGRRGMVAAVRAQERGIGRAMKPTKEAIVGVLAALDERSRTDPAAWRAAEADKVARFVDRAARLPGVVARAEPDPAGMPLSRVHLRIGAAARRDAEGIVAALKEGTPSIRVMEHGLAAGEVIFELVHVDVAEVDVILDRLAAILG